ncbi:MAG: 1-deoxy-D-xylulose-5-phosphate reductoisomerase [Chitinophagales bacterium]|nr:1-deoxy-D-xylulose-5-phosphate reductoisomerase [Chitinophagales bacterium]
MHPELRRIAILGSTGSIGRQALEVISQQKDYLAVEVLCANSNADLLIDQAITFKPNCVVICDESKYEIVNDALKASDIKVYSGIESVCSVVGMETVDVVLAAMVGYAGLRPVLAAINEGKTIALANKETLVVAGELVTQLAREKGVNIYPVDSEHSAIFQCLVGEWHNPIEKILLTASGGPFRGKDNEYLQTVTREQALNHPNWTMGDKITIDSATMMNKGLEMIEAKWLFEVKPEQLEVIIHPQSVVHSLVQFEDGSIKAQMGLPDMRLPIQFALTFPHRMKSSYPRLNFFEHASLTFEPPDTKTFRNLALAYEALSRAGNVPCILNAANEVAVEAFLHDRIKFVELPDVVEYCMGKISFKGKPSYQDYVATDKETRKYASELVLKMT